MACRQSMAHARLMGEISRKRNLIIRFKRTLPSQPLRRVFYFRKAALVRNIPAQAGTGDPDPGARAAVAWAQERGACRRERGEKPDTDGRANLSMGFAMAAHRSAPPQNLFRNFGIVDASHRQGGGEDVCYFVVKARQCRAGSNPARRKAVCPQGQQQHRRFPANPLHAPW
jgi:hypothetical protein